MINLLRNSFHRSFHAGTSRGKNKITLWNESTRPIVCKRYAHEYQKFRLSKVNEHKMAREENKVQIQNSDILHYESNQLQSNDPLEDRMFVAHVRGSDMYIFSVIDGHGGHQCAHAIKHRLPYYLAMYLLSDADITWRSPLSRSSWVVPISGDEYNQWLIKHVFDIRTAESFMFRYKRRLMASSGISKLDPQQQIIQAFEDLDDDLGTEAIPDGQKITKDTVNRLLAATSGACTATAIVNNGMLHVAGLGDCRAVLGTQTAGGGIKATVLTEEHRTYNPIERERLIREHPCEDEDIMFFDERLCGILQPTRAFGDVALKWSNREKVLLQYVFDEPTFVPNYITPPYLITTPDVKSVNLDMDSKFLVIATDGLWDGLSDDEAVKLVHHKPSGINASTWLIQNSLAQNNEQRLSKILNIPPGPICRNVRDDITVMVIYFNS